MRVYKKDGAALLATAFFAASSPLIEYSFNARGYGFGALFVLLAALVADCAILRGSRGAWFTLPIAGALALYANVVTFYGVLGIFLSTAIAARTQRNRAIRALFVTALITGLLYLPVLATVGFAAITGNQWVQPIRRDLWLSAFVTEMGKLWAYWNMDLPFVLGALAAVGVLIAILRPETRHCSLIPLLLCTLTVVFCASALQSVAPPRRTLLYLIPLWLLCAALGWDSVLQKFQRLAWVTPALALMEGAQFICSDFFDTPLDYQMRLQAVRYHPSPTGAF